MNKNGTESLMLKLMDYLPMGAWLRPILIVTVALSFITLADSMTSTVSLMSMKNNTDMNEAPFSIKTFWGLLMGLTSLVFVLNGGLEGIKVVKTIAGFPILFLELFMIAGVLRYLYVNGPALRREVEALNKKDFEPSSTETADQNAMDNDVALEGLVEAEGRS
jgi:choline-glycine betaine transporter